MHTVHRSIKLEVETWVLRQFSGKKKSTLVDFVSEIAEVIDLSIRSESM
jgi:hypothetical protein